MRLDGTGNCEVLRGVPALGFQRQTLTKQFGTPTTPAMASGKADHIWSTCEIAELLN